MLCWVFLPLFLWTLFLGRFFCANVFQCTSHACWRFSSLLVFSSPSFYTHRARSRFLSTMLHTQHIATHSQWEWRRFFRAEKEFNKQWEERWWRKKKAAKTTNSRRDSGQCTLCTFHFQMNGQQNPALKEHKNEFCIFTFLSRFYDFLSSFCRQNCSRVRWWDAMNAKSLFRTSREMQLIGLNANRMRTTVDFMNEQQKVCVLCENFKIQSFSSLIECNVHIIRNLRRNWTMKLAIARFALAGAKWKKMSAHFFDHLQRGYV